MLDTQTRVVMQEILDVPDNISVVVRHTLVQVLPPDPMRGRVAAVSSLFIGASNELGEFESGLVARFLGPVGAAVFGVRPRPWTPAVVDSGRGWQPIVAMPGGRAAMTARRLMMAPS